MAFYLLNMKLAKVWMVAYVPQFHDRIVHRADLKNVRRHIKIRTCEVSNECNIIVNN
jgi:hypothetical protein